MVKFEGSLISKDETIKSAMIKIDKLGKEGHQTLVVVEGMRLVGVCTDGDIRRALVNGIKIDQKISDILNSEFFYAKKNEYDYSKFIQLRESDIKLIPVVDGSMNVVNIIDLTAKRSFLPVDAVLMAGGRGKRLSPLTDKVPKPLLQVNSKPIIQYNLEQFGYYGITDVVITLNYLGQQVENYFSSEKKVDLNISYCYEEEPLGTLGSLTLIDSLQHNTILLMNSDLLTNLNYEDFYLDFMESKAAISVASVPYTVNVPYAVLDTDRGNITGIKEKPSFTYYSSGGIYLIKKELLSFLHYGKYKDAPDFIEEIIAKGYPVRHYPIRSYWLDIGNKEDYYKAQEDVKHIIF
jgi:dTDP-glucose pyrophosphorylase